jgi:predicted Co/Zn/Cd cation transporter (cation efflux family)
LGVTVRVEDLEKVINPLEEGLEELHRLIAEIRKKASTEKEPIIMALGREISLELFVPVTDEDKAIKLKDLEWIERVLRRNLKILLEQISPPEELAPIPGKPTIMALDHEVPLRIFVP